MREYFARFQYQAVSSADFEAMFREKFPISWEKVDFGQWLHGTGGCPQQVSFNRQLVDQAEQLVADWMDFFAEHKDEDESHLIELVSLKTERYRSSFELWDPKRKLRFLSGIGARILSAERSDVVWDWRCVHALESVYEFGKYRNCEMRAWWYRLALKGEYDRVLPNIEVFLREQGRQNYVRQLFQDLHRVFPKGEFARRVFDEVKLTYHPITRKLIERDLAENLPPR